MPPTLIICLLRICFDGLFTPASEVAEHHAVCIFEALYPNDCYTN